ncbi:MAG TPA: hypothetical protein VJS92_01495, partial [Candidatus Polarisedimenticolaceae bacterium]|nr:hypothetical protein [Candidatus Polarisedimenticolaceae bacterium]
MNYRAATPELWPAVVELFGPRGACAGCWCMFWRLPRPQWEARKGAKNRAALRRLVAAGAAPGILAFDGDEP